MNNTQTLALYSEYGQIIGVSTHNDRQECAGDTEWAIEQADDVARAPTDDETQANRVKRKITDATCYSAEDASGGCNQANGAEAPVAESDGAGIANRPYRIVPN